MGHIFISYSRRDTETVDRLVKELGSTGLEIWLDRKDIQAGGAWRAQIVQGIDTCDAFLLVLSPRSILSENVCKEIDLAQDAGRKVFPVMLEPLKLPAELRYQLAGLQFVNVQVLGWETAVSQLASALLEHAAQMHRQEAQATRQAELVIQGIDLQAFNDEVRAQLLQFVAQVSNANPGQLSFAGLAEGTSHVLVNLPIGPAYELKTRALNRDQRFKNFKITSLRLEGDRKYIQIALGILTTAATLGLLQTLWLNLPALFLPVVGATAGKLLTLSVIVAAAAGVTIAAPNLIASTLPPASKPTAAQTTSPPPDVPASKLPTKRTQSTQVILGLEYTATTAPNSTSTLFITSTPLNPLVLVDTLCWLGPGPSYEVVGSLIAGERVELTGRGCDGGWWIIDHPGLHTACWMRQEELQVESGANLPGLESVCAPPLPTATQRACTATTPYKADPQCFCRFHPYDPYCYDPHAP